jgi:alpha-D-ribose 1-methylphosphonate 5-triphosphate synthase subunit PhnH
MIAADPVQRSQRTFRALLAAVAHPGRVTPLAEPVDAPDELHPALAAAALALLDRDVAVWVAPHAPARVGAWLTAATGCRRTAAPAEADFAVILDPIDALPLVRWNAGTPVDPEQSATLLVRVDSIIGGTCARLAGPGIEGSMTVAPLGLPEPFWREWAANTARYPLGIDCFFFDAGRVIGLPRTSAEQPA